MNIISDIESLTSFKRQTPQYVKRLKKSGNSLVLTNKCRTELVVQSAAGYQALLNLLEQSSAIKGVRRGLSSTKRGEGRPIRKVLKEMRRELDEEVDE